MRFSFFSLFIAVFLFVSSLAAMEEGLWMPTQLKKLPWAELQQRGLMLSQEQVYSENQPSLKDAIVLLGEGTGSFVSNNGLILTNYHVVLSAVQSVSTAQRDYIKNGYTARTMEEEIPVPSYTAKALISMKEVTKEILSVVDEKMTDVERSEAIKAKAASMEIIAKGKTDHECTVVPILFGLQYFLYEYEVIRDVRIVLSPPSTIGAFGGEEDNWMWPRHTGDFAFMRAYVAPDGKKTVYSKTNVPYKPKMVFPISTQGYNEGTFAMVMGFPGLTLRQMASPGIQAAQDITLPYLLELTNLQLDILRRTAEQSQVNAVIYANKILTLANTSKYIEGTLRGIKKKDVVNIKQVEEVELWDYIFADPALEAKYGTVMIDLDTAYVQFRSMTEKQIVCSQLISAIQLLRIASVFKDYANSFREGEQPNPQYKNNLKNFYFSTLKNTDLEIDKELFTVLVQKAAALPDEQQIEVVKKIYGDKKYKEKEEALKAFVDSLYENTLVATKEECDLLVEWSPNKIRAEEFVDFATGLDKESKKVQDDLAKLDIKITALLRKLTEVKQVWKGETPYPDANRTLRFNYGSVKAYQPRNSVYYHYFTTLSGVMEKRSVDDDQFDVPPALLRLWESRDLGTYADTTMKDIPVAFITNTDISGGNSGSPILNGKGELMGVAFDGNWEGMAGDYLYQENLNRTISVDCRYILFYLEKYTGAQNILQELIIK